jgi:hypothetical protein
MLIDEMMQLDMFFDMHCIIKAGRTNLQHRPELDVEAPG